MGEVCIRVLIFAFVVRQHLEKRNKNRLIPGIILINFIILLLSYSMAAAVDRDELRVKAGLDYFLSLLTADLDIADKKGDDGFLTLLLIYTDKKPETMEMAGILGSLKSIKGIPVRVEITDDLAMSSYRDKPPAGIFIAQPLGDKLSDVIYFAVNNGIVLFSPFQGDVEKGVLGGIHISDRVLPYINLSSMKSSGIHIKEFFIRISVTYDQ